LTQRQFGVSRGVAFGERVIRLPWGQSSRGGKMNILNKKKIDFMHQKSFTLFEPITRRLNK
jgi:hypothetical protein